MTPNGTKTKPTTRTVFDLSKFDDVKLTKDYEVPAKPTSMEEALAAVDNDEEKLFEVIQAGLEKRAGDAAYNDINGFRVIDENGEPGEEYTGPFADDEVSKKVNAAILSMAKLWGYSKDMSKADKDKLKTQAVEVLRSNPLTLKNLAGV